MSVCWWRRLMLWRRRLMLSYFRCWGRCYLADKWRRNTFPTATLPIAAAGVTFTATSTTTVTARVRTTRGLFKPLLDDRSSGLGVHFSHHILIGHDRTTRRMMELETFIVRVAISIGASRALGRDLDGTAHCSPVNGRSWQWICGSDRGWCWGW